ncbi:MarR family transcriptional regulator [Streptomyces griseorubiginosus]|uniref:MarR family transcriptional regulator n=1 Tax=Streptomyces griseorubiginosus TaxID=67304 RepID=UPI002E814161|nr:MarR family transcriptional regulator [Streptomyces griseorubiginosus]WUB44598.1 MarR family transcriptional regulator [Streptomyces griseorubiginosus]WUB53115.1 MarR family transcriptional regulator [Streptomyces griseorubiginosus]
MSGHEHLAQALAECGRDSFTGELRVRGTPGGTFHFGDGRVVAVESPGAPGPEALLLRSGRVSGEQWAELVRESGGSRWPATALIAHGYAGAAQLRVVCALALRDAAFAMAAGRVESCERVNSTELFAQVPLGEPPLRLLQDATRRLTALAALPYPVHPDRERPVASGTDQGSTALRRELLSHADGRRTARDLAFRVGRGVYTVTVEVARMLDEGLMVCAPPPAPVPVRALPDGHALRPRKPPQGEQPPPPAYGDLPRRKPGSFFRLRNGTPK